MPHPMPDSLRFRILACCLITVAAVLSRSPAVSAADDEATVHVRILGDGPAAARVSITNGNSQPLAPTNVHLRNTSRGESYFYADGAFDVTVPAGAARMQFSRGIECIPQSLLVDSGTAADVTVHLPRWIDMAARGWYSGDSHVHLHTGGPLEVTPRDALIAARAEGVHYVNLCVSNAEGDDIRDPELITGRPHPLSTDRHLIVFGEEMRSSIYGHMQFFGIRQLVQPQYTGFDNTPHHLDFPENYVMAAEAVRQGGVVTYGHPMFANQPDPFGGDLTASNAAARELPVDSILGVVHAVDLMSYNSDKELSARLWYRLLNCGLKLSACVGTDALLDRSTNPLGGDRVYVKVDGPLSMQAWLDGLRKGRSFVTNGPMLTIDVAGKGPGETCRLAEPGTVRVTATVESLVPFDRAEIIAGGKVVHTQPGNRLHAAPPADSPGVRVQRFAVDVPVSHSSWAALRVQGPDDPRVMDGPVWAHTSPVYVQIADEPIASPEDAAYFVEWIDRLLGVVAARNRYPTADDRRQVEARFREAQDRFRRIANPYKAIFDGKSLDGWEGDPTYWRVEDGNLVGEVTPETLLKRNSWIVWRGGLVEDFELLLEYRVSAGGNSGVGYRCAEIEGQPYAVRGPQADIDGANMWTGQCYEEGGRRFLAARGQSTWIDPGQLPQVVAQFADPAELQSVVRNGDWNRYRLVVRGNDAQHYLNDVLMCEVHDHDEANRLHRGLLGVQVHVGPPMKIEYRKILLRHLGTPPPGDPAAGKVVYRPGQLFEPDHAATFEHLKEQTARLTAPPPKTPLNDQQEIIVTTRRLAAVRHDLQNVAAFGNPPKPMPDRESTFDLVVAVDDQHLVRVPGAGPLLHGKSLARAYRVELTWNADRRQYDVRSLTPADESSSNM